jgi:hypothetical protein
MIALLLGCRSTASINSTSSLKTVIPAKAGIQFS